LSNVTLEIEGQNYQGWTEISISKSIEHLCGGFDLTLTDRWSGGNLDLAILPGSPCRVAIDGQTVINGYVFGFEISYDADAHQIRVTGKDKTADLVDCAIANGTGEWKNLKLEDLVSELVKPFWLTVKADVDTGERIPKFNAEQGMTVYDAVQKLCVLRGCLAIPDDEGNIVITRAGTEQGTTNLAEGDNILAATASYDFSERFSDYIVKGQKSGKDNEDSKTTTAFKSNVQDENIKRYRPTIVMAEGQVDGIKTKVRAQWECAVRRGKSRNFRITVQGWKGADGKIWELNKLVKLTSPLLGIDDQLLIAGADFKLSDQGEMTELLLSPAEAYQPVEGLKVSSGDKWEKDLKSFGKLWKRYGKGKK